MSDRISEEPYGRAPSIDALGDARLLQSETLCRREAIEKAAAERALMTWAAAIHSALYLTFVFVAGLVLGHHAASFFAIAAEGVSYLCVAVQLLAPERRLAAIVLFAFSIVFGLLAGVSLFM